MKAKTLWGQAFFACVVVVVWMVGLKAAETAPEPYNANIAYPKTGTLVVYTEPISTGGYKVGVFKNGWYLGAGIPPKFYPNSEGWIQVGDSVVVSDLNDAKGTTQPASDWSEKGTYSGGSVVTYKGSCYKAKWWTTDAPDTATWSSLTCPNGTTVDNPWVSRAAPPASSSDGSANSSTDNVSTQPPVPPVENAKPTAANPEWVSAGVYLAGSVVQHGGLCYKAKWWTSGNTPVPRAQLSNEWDSPWSELIGCPTSASLPANSIVGQVPPASNTPSSADTDPALKAAAQPPTPQATTEQAIKTTQNTNSPAIPPVIPKEPIKASTAVTSATPIALPSEGYAFLRQVTRADWDWLFPLRSGKFNAAGGTRNSPPFAKEDGSTDTFTLDAFVRAVLQYNTWAKQNGYKQFLNEGSLKQQAEEFLVFWAKSSRETSGSWSTAASPWIVNDDDNPGAKVWKGGLYWVEEVGYSTNPDGTSASINYVDDGSVDFKPVDKRSYYGRGVIQLSWNYNYGAFSYWMFDNGLFKTASDAAGRCLIDQRNKLLVLPNLVAECGDLSILSGIWFWMTPQGAKPSSHDVLYGDVINISASTNDRGLPQTNNGYVPKVARGETNDPEVFAWRLGTIINIVNGGLECNKASKWHNGPLQRVSYYNAYAAHFNRQYSVGATRVTQATNVWTSSVSDSDSVNLQSATCYNQKSYYGW